MILKKQLIKAGMVGMVLLPQSGFGQSADTTFNQVLSEYVDAGGRVNYDALRKNPFALKSFVDFIAEVSPDSKPELFPTPNTRKAYWINAYNALVMSGIIENPGISSVKEVALTNGFFRQLKFIVGGEPMTLNHIEHDILRAEYQDPRIHFAINCGSASCPVLGERMYDAKDLDARLDSAAAHFIRDTANVRINYESQTIYCSQIFKWYAEDFEKSQFKGVIPTIARYLEDEQKRRVDISDFELKYLDYNWELNEQKPRD